VVRPRKKGTFMLCRMCQVDLRARMKRIPLLRFSKARFDSSDKRGTNRLFPTTTTMPTDRRYQRAEPCAGRMSLAGQFSFVMMILFLDMNFFRLSLFYYGISSRESRVGKKTTTLLSVSLFNSAICSFVLIQ
jgi:hypothetical protein